MKLVIPAANVVLCIARDLHEAKQKMSLNPDFDGVVAGNWSQDVDIKVHCLIARNQDRVIVQMHVVNREQLVGRCTCYNKLKGQYVNIDWYMTFNMR